MALHTRHVTAPTFHEISVERLGPWPLRALAGWRCRLSRDPQSHKMLAGIQSERKKIVEAVLAVEAKGAVLLQSCAKNSPRTML